MYKKSLSLLKRRESEHDVASGSIQRGGPNDDDPIGLKVIYTPSGERRADIIFLHGLGGSSRATWSKNRDVNFFWPLNLLPHEPDINESRILTFGYNANFRPGSSKSKVSILDFAKELLFDLKYAQDETGSEIEDLQMGEKPIIFIAHSMGGLVVKEAYMQGQSDPTYQDIVKSITSIIFLSTPHRGTHLAETLNRILQVSFIANPMQFIAELTIGSQTLQKLNEQFRHVAPKLQIVSFYETLPTPLKLKAKIMVLEKDSSILGYPGEISKPLNADHHGVCKYDSSDDPRYITVRNALKALVGKAKPQSLEPDTRTEGPYSTFEEYLSVPESPDKDYNFFRDRWVPGTCNWVLTHDTFTDWMNDTSSGSHLVWIQGNAASGKSILSSFIIDHLVQLGLPCSYFFVRFNELKKRSPSILLRSLACQLARLLPAYAEKLLQLETATTDLKTAELRKIWQWLYRQTLLQLDIHHPLFIVIDGLDEADSPGDVVRLLAHLQASPLPLRILIVSRNTHGISSAWQKSVQQMRAETIIMGGQLEDFRSYIDQKMEVAGEDGYAEQVAKQILQRARGNFLWLHLVVQKINSCHTKANVEEALSNLSPGMEGLYERMATSIRTLLTDEDRSLGQKILGWATCAQRLLSVEELSDALSNEGLIEIHRTIGDLCGGFVVVDIEGKVSMIHETARQYLVRGSHNAEKPLLVDQNTTHLRLFRRCIRTLMDPALRSLINRNKPPALLDYATKFWVVHLSHCKLTDPETVNTVVKFFKGPHVLTWISITARNQELSALVVASRHLLGMVTELRRRRNGAYLDYDQALNTIEGWATDLAKIVGKFGNALVQNPDAIHKLIPPFCPESSMVFQQFGRKEPVLLQVSGSTSNIVWDDCLARFSMEKGVVASAVVTGGNHLAILTTSPSAMYTSTSTIIIYNTLTFERERCVTHPESVTSIQLNQLGSLLVSYGYLTTRVWDVATGTCTKVVQNPPNRPQPQTMLFDDGEKNFLVGGEDGVVRSFSLLEGEDEQWLTRANIAVAEYKCTVRHFSMCSALSPDGTMIAYGHNFYPLTVWELEPPMLIQESTFGEVCQVAWHPHSDEREVFGIDKIGVLFKWNPYDESLSAKVSVGHRAHAFTLSADGSLIGVAVGAMKLYATSDLSLLYQLSSADRVLDLAFSSDSRCLYDVRGTHGDVWQPNILIRLAENSEYPDYNSDSITDVESLVRYPSQAEYHVVKNSNIKALAGQSVGPLYCYVTDGGVAMLCDTSQGKVCELEKSANYGWIQQVAWSADGRYVAIVDSRRKLTVKRVTKSGKRGKSSNTWQVDPVVEMEFPSTDKEPVDQLFFNPLSLMLFASTSTVIFSVDIFTMALKQTELRPDIRVRWLCHSTIPGYLLGFGSTRMHVFDWSSLEEVGGDARVYSPHRLGTPKETGEVLGRLVVSETEPSHILLQIWYTESSSQLISAEYIIFNLDEIRGVLRIEDMSDSLVTELSYTKLPQEVLSRIREPLAILSYRRLVFLDQNRWICTWQLPSTAQDVFTARQPPGQIGTVRTTEKIEQHYFLPGDWVTADEARMCAIMRDGTLLCPRNGQVGTVQAAKLRN